MRKWAFKSNVLLYWLVRVVPTGGGPQRCAAAPALSSWPGSAALGGAGLAVRLAVLVALVAGLLATAGRLAWIPTGLTALLAGASLPALATTHGAAHSGGQR